MDLLGRKKKASEKKFDNEINLAIGATLERFGSANAEFFNELPELQKMQSWKNNFDAQKGFAAEIKYTSRTNAENIVDGKLQRVARTDDVGKVNHQNYDHVQVDASGDPILDSAGNFVGGSQQKVHNSLSGYDKYYSTEASHNGKSINWYEKYQDGKLVVPSDQINALKARWASQIESLQEQETVLRQNGNTDLANQKHAQAERIKDLKSRLKDSKVTVEESLEARTSPTWSTVKDIAKYSHKAGVESAKMGATLGGTISAFQNTKAYLNGDKDAGEATLDLLKDTGKAGAKAYAVGASSAAAGGVLKASGNQILKNLAKKSGPTAIVLSGVILAKQTTNLILGKITPTEFAENINREGFTLASSLTGGNLGAVVGTMAMPGVGTIVGGVVGGMVASMMSGALFNELKKSLNDTKMSAERRKMVEAMCDNLIKQETQYREAMTKIFDEYLDEKETEIRNGFESMSIAIQNGNSLSGGLAIVGKAFNLELKFNSVDDFRTHVQSGQVLKI